jgi:hypothetical protein
MPLHKEYQVKHALAAAVVYTAFVLGSCGDIMPMSDADALYHDLTIDFRDMSDYIDKPLYARVVHIAENREIERSDKSALPGATYQISFGSILEDGESYRIELFVDQNANNRYDAAIDHSWEVILADVADNQTVSFSPVGETRKTITWPV